MLNISRLRDIENRITSISDDDFLVDDIRIVKTSMPYEIKGLAIRIGSWYQIEINDQIPDNQQYDALMHELHHIAHNDFDRCEPVEDIEAENPY